MRVRDRIKQLTKVVNTWSTNGEQLAISVAEQLYIDLDTPTSLGLYIALKSGDIETVVNHSIDPRSYLDSLRFRDDYLAVSYLKKFPFRGREHITRRKAVDKFLEAEDLCRQTNSWFRRYRASPLIADPTTHAIFHGMTRKIASILGSFSYARWVSHCRFGPGATNVCTGVRANIHDKLSCKLSATADAAAAAVHVVNGMPAWLRSRSGLSPFDDGPYCRLEVSDLELALGNTITFVPKDARSDRAIAIEPHLNIFLQLGVGALIRDRLKRHGLDLDDATPNQELARRGSLIGDVATIDLSSASDTISREVVREFIPSDWFEIMELIRSKTGTMEDDDSGQKKFWFEKFSSMGNGFTFELETLIFFSLAQTVTEFLGEPQELVRVYGDDIVVPSACVELLTKMLGVLGFKMNREKSFFEGPFRESCGKDFYNGNDVRPIFLKESLSDAKSLIRMANGLRRLAYRRNHGFGCDARLRPTWVHAVRRLPDSLRRDVRGPLYLTIGGNKADFDGALGTSLDEASASPFVLLSRKPKARGWDGHWWHFARILETPKEFKPRDRAAAYASWLYGLSRGRTTAEIEDPDKKDGVRFTPFTVPYRSLTTTRVTVRGLSHGWSDDIGWI